MCSGSFEDNDRRDPIYPTPRFGQNHTRSIFKAEFSRFEFRVFLLLD